MNPHYEELLEQYEEYNDEEIDFHMSGMTLEEWEARKSALQRIDQSGTEVKLG